MNGIVNSVSVDENGESERSAQESSSSSFSSIGKIRHLAPTVNDSSVKTLEEQNEELARKLKATKLELEMLRQQLDGSAAAPKVKTPMLTSFKLDQGPGADIIFVKHIVQKSKARTIRSFQFTLVVDSMYRLRAYDRHGKLVSNELSLCPPQKVISSTNSSSEGNSSSSNGSSSSINNNSSTSNSESINNFAQHSASTNTAIGSSEPSPTNHLDSKTSYQCSPSLGRLSAISYEGSDHTFPLLIAAFEEGSVSIVSFLARGGFQDVLAGVDFNRKEKKGGGEANSSAFAKTKFVEYTPINRTMIHSSATSKTYETEINSGEGLHGGKITFRSLLSFHAFNSFKNSSSSGSGSSSGDNNNNLDSDNDEEAMDENATKPAITSSLIFYDVNRNRHLIYIGDSIGRISQFDTSRRMLRQVNVVSRRFVHDGSAFEDKTDKSKRNKLKRKPPQSWPLTNKKSGSFIGNDDVELDDDSSSCSNTGSIRSSSRKGHSSSNYNKYTAVTYLARSNNILLVASYNKISILQLHRLIFIDDICTLPPFDSFTLDPSAGSQERLAIGYDIADVYADVQRPHILYASYRPIFLREIEEKNKNNDNNDNNSGTFRENTDSNSATKDAEACSSSLTCGATNTDKFRYSLGSSSIAIFNLKATRDNPLGTQTSFYTNCEISTSFSTQNPNISSTGSSSSSSSSSSEYSDIMEEYDWGYFVSGRLGIGSAIRASEVVTSVIKDTLFVKNSNCEFSIYNVSQVEEVIIEDSINICKNETENPFIEGNRYRVFIDATPEIRKSLALSDRDSAFIQSNSVFSIFVASIASSALTTNSTLSVAHFSGANYFVESPSSMFGKLGRIHYFLIMLAFVFLFNIGKRLWLGPEKRAKTVDPKFKEKFLKNRYRNSYDSYDYSNSKKSNNNNTSTSNSESASYLGADVDLNFKQRVDFANKRNQEMEEEVRRLEARRSSDGRN